MKFGILGAGRIANKFCDAVKLIENATVVAVASKSLERAKDFAEKHGIERYYDNYAEMLQSDIDVVYIATTHNFHFENALLCIEYNKPFLCEKSFVLHKADAVKAFEAAKAKNLFSMEAMWSRFLPTMQKAKKWIEEGWIGEIQMSHAIFGFKAQPEPEHRINNKALAGGALYDIGVYGILCTTYLVGQNIQEVKAMYTETTSGVDKVDAVLIRFENCIGNVQCLISAKVNNSITIYGSEGYITLPEFFDGKVAILSKNDGSEERFECAYENGFVYQIQEVIDCIQKGKLESDVMPHKDSIQCAEIFDICLT